MTQLYLPQPIMDLGIRSSRGGALDEQRPQLCPLGKPLEMELDQLRRRTRFDERIGEVLEVLGEAGLDGLHEQNRLVGEVPVDRTGRQSRRTRQITDRDRRVTPLCEELDGGINESFPCGDSSGGSGGNEIWGTCGSRSARRSPRART